MPGGGWLEYWYSKKAYRQAWVDKMRSQDAVFVGVNETAIERIARGDLSLAIGVTSTAVATQAIRAGRT